MRGETEAVMKKVPFIRILPVFILGILISEHVKPEAEIILLILAVLFLLNVFTQFIPLHYFWKLKNIFGLCMLTMLFLLGMLCRTMHPFFLTKKKSLAPGCHILRVEQIIQKKNHTIQAECAVFVKENKQWIYKNICIVYIRNRNDIATEGSLILAYIDPVYIKPLHNPGAYDYAYHQHIKGIFYQASINENTEAVHVGKQQRKFTHLINAVRDYILTVLRKSLGDKQTYGLAEAMMIGYREDLDNDILDSYVNTGVVHVIAISGMHLSLIFLLIDLFVGIVFKKRRKDMVGLFITIPLLWLFAILTGSSASVVRSALMLTFILISKAMGKRSSGMNALLGSAFMLVAWSPWMIYDLGFQLSYLAVASMMLFEKPIRCCIYTKNIILTKGWEMISVTLAAQILTTPISIFNFHQFPSLFLFTNLLAIPISSLILLAEILLCLLDFCTLPHRWIDGATHHFISWLNAYIFSMEHVPYGMIKHIHIGAFTMLLAYALIAMIRYATSQPSRLQVWTVCCMFIFTLAVYQAEKMYKSTEQLFIVPRQKKGLFCYYKHGDEMRMFCSKALLRDQELFNLTKEQLANVYWVNKFSVIPVVDTPMVLKLGLKGKKEASIYLITGNPPGVAFLSKLNIQPTSLVVADATNKLWKIRVWETEAEKLLLRFHSVGEEGPVILDLPKQPL